MAGFSRINPDVIDLGTTTLAGVSVRMFAGSRAPYDGAWTSTAWANATPYIIGQAVVMNGNIYNAVANHTSNLGVNDPESDSYVGPLGSFWKKVDGNDGDVWFRKNGANSDTYQKANNVWTSLGHNFTGAAITLLDSQTGTTAFSFDAASYPSATIEYYMSTPAGDLERGTMTIMNDGSSAIGTVYNVNSINNALGIDFLFAISGSDVVVSYDSTATPINRTLLYILRR
jgi:hypothetical protein